MEPDTSAMPTSEFSPPARLVDDQSTGDGLNITRYFHDYLAKGDGDLTDHAYSSTDVHERLPPLKSALSKILADQPLVPYESVPCANIDAQDRQCTKNGNSRCGGCALVLYCSQVSFTSRYDQPSQ
jgi:hypothetical protein